MGDNGFDTTKYDNAAASAQTELQETIKGMSPEQRKAVDQIQAWWKKWYTEAGHKRLGRIINSL